MRGKRYDRDQTKHQINCNYIKLSPKLRTKNDVNNTL